MHHLSLARRLEADRAYYAGIFASRLPAEEHIRAEKKRIVRNLYHELALLESSLRAIEADFGYKYSPDQPRVPAGNPDGGQWTSGGGGGDGGGDPALGFTDSGAPIHLDDLGIEGYSVSPLPVIGALGMLGGAGEAAGFAEGAGSAAGEGAAAVDTEWTLGDYKSPQRWANQMESRDWTPAQITDAISSGEQFPAPNYINPGNPATLYQTDIPGRYIVRDDVTKEIIQMGKEGFDPPVLPKMINYWWRK